MATYANAGDNSNILTDTTGGTSLTGTDIVNVVQGDTQYSSNLDALGTTSFAEFNTTPGFRGQLGDHPAGLLVNAGIIRLEDAGHRHAIKCTASHTVDKLIWKNQVAGTLTVHNIDDITLAALLAPGAVNFLDSADVATAHVKSPGLTAFFEAGAAAATLIGVGGHGRAGVASALVDRDVATLSVYDGGHAKTRESCSPTTLNANGGRYDHQSDGGLGTINVNGKCVIDFSRALADIASITWNLTSDLIIIEPANGISIDMPTSGEEGEFRVEYRKGA